MIDRNELLQNDILEDIEREHIFTYERLIEIYREPWKHLELKYLPQHSAEKLDYIIHREVEFRQYLEFNKKFSTHSN